MESSSRATSGFWPPRILMSASSSRSLAIMAAWEPASPTESRSEGLCRLANWMSPPLPAMPRESRRSASKLIDRGDAEAHLLPDLVAHDDAQVAGLGDLAQAAAPGVQAQQRDPDRLVAQRLEPGQAERLDRGAPVDLDVGVVVEQAGQGAGDELAERVAQQPGLVEELPGRLVLAGLDRGPRWGCAAGATARGWWSRAGRCCRRRSR